MPQYAGFWRRAAATILDSIIFSVLTALLLGSGYLDAGLWSAKGLLGSALGLLLTVALWLKFSGTPGKLLLGCQVVDADSYAPLSTKQAVLRYVGYLVSFLPLGLGFLWVAWDPRKQGFHDKIANSVVLFDAQLVMDDESRKSLEQLMAEVR